MRLIDLPNIKKKKPNQEEKWHSQTLSDSIQTFCDSIPSHMASGHFLFQGIFLAQGLNPGLLYHKQIICQLNDQEAPKEA